MVIKQPLLISWYLQRIKTIKKRRKRTIVAATLVKHLDLSTKTRQIAFIEAILICLCHTRDRSLWMHPRSFTWIEMVEQTYNDELWYVNFRITKGTFRFLLDSIGEEIYHPYTVMRSHSPYTFWHPLQSTERSPICSETHDLLYVYAWKCVPCDY